MMNLFGHDLTRAPRYMLFSLWEIHFINIQKLGILHTNCRHWHKREEESSVCFPIYVDLMLSLGHRRLSLSPFLIENVNKLHFMFYLLTEQHKRERRAQYQFSNSPLLCPNAVALLRYFMFSNRFSLGFFFCVFFLCHQSAVRLASEKKKVFVSLPCSRASHTIESLHCCT